MTQQHRERVRAVVDGEQIESPVAVHVDSREALGILARRIVDARFERAVAVAELNADHGRGRALARGCEVLLSIAVEVTGHDAHAELRSGVALRLPERAVPGAEENRDRALDTRDREVEMAIGIEIG